MIETGQSFAAGGSTLGIASKRICSGGHVSRQAREGADMRINVVGKGIEITDAIKLHAESKADKLPRYFDGVQQITITVSHEDSHPRGQLAAEIVVDVEKHEDFVAHASGDDLYLVIDAVVQKASRQLSDFKEKLKLGHR